MKRVTKKKKADFLNELAAMLPKKRVERARKQAKKEIYQIQLSELRKKMGIRQEDELKNKEFVEKSKSFMNTILKLQTNFRDTLVKLGLMQATGHTLDTVA